MVCIFQQKLLNVFAVTLYIIFHCLWWSLPSPCWIQIPLPIYRGLIFQHFFEISRLIFTNNGMRRSSGVSWKTPLCVCSMKSDNGCNYLTAFLVKTPAFGCKQTHRLLSGSYFWLLLYQTFNMRQYKHTRLNDQRRNINLGKNMN